MTWYRTKEKVSKLLKAPHCTKRTEETKTFAEIIFASKAKPAKDESNANYGS